MRATGPQSLQVDKEKVDLGDIKLGQLVSVAFELTNTGSQPLQFTEPAVYRSQGGVLTTHTGHRFDGPPTR